MKNIQFSFLLLFVLCIANYRLPAQCITVVDPCVCPVVNLTNGNACPGTTFTVTPTAVIPTGTTVQNYSWTPAADVTPSSGLGMPGITSIIFPSTTTTYSLTTTFVGPNLILNSDFDGGNSCFGTNYVFSMGATNQGIYKVDNNIGYGLGACTMTDRSGIGNMMVVNGANVLGIGGSFLTVWSENIPVCNNTTYQFSAWYACWSTPATPAQLQVYINNIPCGPVFFPNTGCGIWQQLQITWPSGVATSANIEIRDQSLAYVGNDFALDDISFNRICSSTTTMTLTPIPAPVFNLVPHPDVCSGDGFTLDATIISGCSGGCTYAWSFGSTTIPSSIQYVYTPSGISWSYNLTVTDPITGCNTTHGFYINVNAVPDSITGPDTVCENATIILSDAHLGGVWSCSNTSIATIDPATGTLTGVSAGTATITYALYGPCFVTKDITVLPSPSFTLTPPFNICSGDLFTLDATITGGCPGGCIYNWSTGATTIPTPVMTYTTTSGFSPIYTLTVTNTYGCSTTASTGVTVFPLPAPITGTSTGCTGSTSALSDASGGGVWTSAATSVATIDPITGIFTGVSSGTTTITYTTLGGCYVTTVVTVNPSPSFTPDYAPKPLCEGTPWRLYWNGLPLSAPCSGCSYVWTGPVGSGAGFTSTLPNPPMPAAGPGITGVYTLTVTQGGCSATRTLSVNVTQRATACVTVGWDPTCACYVFTVTGTPGAVAHYICHDFYGGTLPGTFTTPLLPTATIPLSSLPGGTGSICIVSVSIGGCTWPCNCPTGCCAGLNEPHRMTGGTTSGISTAENVNNKLSVIPNPNKGEFTISGDIPNASANKTLKIEVLDMLGKTIYSDEATVDKDGIHKKITLDNSIANGVYFIKVQNDGISDVIRFTLNR